MEFKLQKDFIRYKIVLLGDYTSSKPYFITRVIYNTFENKPLISNILT